MVLEVIYYHVVIDPKYNSDIGLQGFGLNLYNE